MQDVYERKRKKKKKKLKLKSGPFKSLKASSNIVIT